MTTETTLLIVGGVGVAGFIAYQFLKPAPAPAASTGLSGLFGSLFSGVTTAIPSFINSIESAFTGGSSVSPNSSS